MWISIAAICGALAVMAGAFGAHGLKGRLTVEQLASWSTASQYHLLHSIVLLALALFWIGCQDTIEAPTDHAAQGEPIEPAEANPHRDCVTAALNEAEDCLLSGAGAATCKTQSQSALQACQ